MPDPELEHDAAEDAPVSPASRRWARRHRRALWVAVVLAVLAAFGLGLAAREKLKERQDWVLAWESDYSRGGVEALLRDWRPLSKPHWGPGAWTELDAGHRDRLRVEDGVVSLVSDVNITNLVWRRPLTGDYRVEWQATPVLSEVNLNCFLGPDRERGLTFHVAGWNDPTSVCATMGPSFRFVDMQLLDRPIERGRTYRFALERSDARATLSVDGVQVLEYLAIDDAVPDGFGIDCYAFQTLQVTGLRIWRRPLAQRVSALAIAEELYRSRSYDAAARRCEEILAAYPGSDLAAGAHFWLGLSRIRQGDAERGLSLLADFESMHPRHELVPYSLHERLRHAVAAKDGGRETRVREALAAFPGHPAPAVALRERGMALVKELAALPPGDPALVERTTAALDEISRWASRYGVDWLRHRLAADAADVLLRHGRYDEVMARFPNGSRPYARALYATGRFDELWAMSENTSWVQHGLIVDASDPQILRTAPDPRLSELSRLQFTGRHDEILARYPESWQAHDVLLATGRAEELLVRYPQVDAGDRHAGGWRGRALMALKRYEDLLRESDSPGARARALLALGRLDEAEPAAIAAPNSTPLALVAVERLRAGDLDGVRRCCDLLAGMRQIYNDDGRMMAEHLLPAMAPAFMGRGAEARAALTALAQERPMHFRQMMRYVAERAVGTIGDESFMRQPVRRGAEGRLELARAIAAEIAGDRDAALGAWQRMMALPAVDGHRPEVESSLARARIAMLSAP